MQDYHQRLISNMEAFAAHENKRMPLGMDKAQVFSYVVEHAVESRVLMDDSNRIIAEYLQPVFEDPYSITDEHADELAALACQLYSLQRHVDMGLAFPLHDALLKRARAREDLDRMLLHIYWKGMIYLKWTEKLYVRDALACFEEGAGYREQYFSIESRDTRMLINRCLGNVYVAVSSFRTVSSDYTAFFEAVDRAVAFWTDPLVRALDPDFPWDAFISNSNQNVCSWVDQLRTTKADDAYLAQRVYESTLALYGNAFMSTAREFPSSRVAYMVSTAKYHHGLIGAQEVFDNLYSLTMAVEAGDYSTDAMYRMLHTSVACLHYQKLIPGISPEILDETSRGVMDRVFRYCKSLPDDVDRFLLNMMLAVFARPSLEYQTAQADDYVRSVLRMTTFTHLPTYVHSIMVGKIMRLVANYFVEYQPERLIGVSGTASAQDVKLNKRKVLDEIELAGLAHDAGKIVYSNTVTVCSRKLTDAEFAIIKQHTTAGFDLISIISEYECISAVMRGHHKTYDGKAGYPVVFDNLASPYKFVIDLASIADSIDAATDIVGRSYAQQRTLGFVIQEINDQSGTRYNPEIARILKIPGIYAQIEQVLSIGRKDAYFIAYQDLYGSGNAKRLP